jgi:caffeoyl-CoA O-methyltransferase
VFHDIPESVIAQMRRLETLDAADRQDGTPRLQRLRQVSHETGQFLAILAAGAPRGAVIEIGTSGGYSTLWLAIACALRGDRIKTFEILPEKVKLARRTFEGAGVLRRVHLVEGDARDHLSEQTGIAFCFLDAEKDIYEECYELIVPSLVAGGILVADNVISHQDELGSFVQAARLDAKVDSVIVPLGQGLLVSRRC